MEAIRRLEFDAGHRLLNHEGKCRNLHGHRYVVEVHAKAQHLDTLGRVIDFSVLKGKLGSWLDEHWDHGMILNTADTSVINLCLAEGQRYWCMPCNPTAENMADYLLREICPHLFKDDCIEITKITMWETPNCRVEARL